MTRTTKADLDRLVRIVSREYDLPEYGWRREGTENVATVGALVIDSDATGKRLMQVASRGGGLWEISPRLAAGDLAVFLRGMVAVADVIRHHRDPVE